MKICVLTQTYTVTGVPLAQIRFARALREKGYDVDLTYGKIDPEAVPEPPAGVRVVELGRLKVRGLIGPLARYLRSAQPDIVFSAEDHLTGAVLLAAIIVGAKARISGSSRVSPFETYSNRPFTRGWLFKHMLRAVMWRANALTCVSMDMVSEYRKIFKDGPHVCVYNLVVDQEATARIAEQVSHQWLVDPTYPVVVAAGALIPRKGFADLIRAVGELQKKGRPIRLLLIGDGPRRKELTDLCDLLDIKQHVCLLGRVSNPLKYFAHARVFVLSSYAEGLPNVLVEAMMCGCTPVATDCPTGPREVLADGRYGYLVEVGNPASIAAGIEQALDRPISKDLLAEAVRPFEVSNVLRRHFEVLGLSQLQDRPSPSDSLETA